MSSNSFCFSFHGTVLLFWLWGLFNFLVLVIARRSSSNTSSDKSLVFPMRAPASFWTRRIGLLLFICLWLVQRILLHFGHCFGHTRWTPDMVWWRQKEKTRPPERRKQVTTSEDENLLEHCAMTMHVTCVAMSLDKLEPERQHGNFCTTWQLFLQTQKLTLAPSK